MTPALSRLTKVLVYVALFGFLDRMLDVLHFRAALLNAFVDSLSLAVGVGSRYIDWALVAMAAAGTLWTLTTVCSALAGMVKR